jgi:UPF0716 protein FxsA
MGKSILAIWFVGELFAYAAILSQFGVFTGLLIGTGSTILGLLALRMAGERLTLQAAAILAGGIEAKQTGLFPLIVLGAILLLLPGFASDAVGLILVVAGAPALMRRTPPKRDRDIDLSPGEWTRRPDEPPR